MVATSVIGLAFIIERGLALRWNKVVPADIVTAVDACRTSADRPTLHRICEKNKSSLARLVLTAEEHLDLPQEENENALQTRARREIVRLERGLGGAGDRGGHRAADGSGRDYLRDDVAFRRPGPGRPG